MTKRILALLLAVLFAVSCCMMTACGDDDKKPADDKTQQGEDNKKPDDSKNPTDNNSDKKPEDDKKSGDATSGKTSDASSGGLLDDYNAADEFEGEAVDIQFYEAAKFETWTGKVGEVTWTWWQSVVSIHPDDLNVTEGLGTDDYAYKWTMHVRPADAHSTPDKEDDKWISRSLPGRHQVRRRRQNHLPSAARHRLRGQVHDRPGIRSNLHHRRTRR